MKIMVVFGTRPEAIKMCPVILELKKHSDIEVITCLTGQHKEMLEQVMNVFEIKEDYNLDIMRQKQSLCMITSSVLLGVENIIKKEKPDIVLVHGDTTTSFATSLVAFYNQIPIGHIEAGLRTRNMKSPFPEEFNRQAVDLIADMYFAPTNMAKNNLIREGKNADKIWVTGNTVIDALKTTIRKDYSNEHIDWAKDSKLLLITAHRRENIGVPMENIFSAIKSIVERNEDVKVIYPIHKNPLVREIAKKYLLNNDRIRLIEPLDVIDFHNFMNKSYLILTDSGGVQEEAPSLGKPVLVMRDTTERPEGVEAGVLKLVGTDKDKIVRETEKLINDSGFYNEMSKKCNPYGDGFASEKIVRYILDFFKFS